MKPEEKLAETYLRHLGYVDVVHEPDGNVLPDFLVDGHIGVEVRRLNQNFHSKRGYEGLETAEKNLAGQFNTLIKSIGPPNPPTSWFVSYCFARPVESWKTRRRNVKDALQTFMNASVCQPNTVQIDQRFRVEFFGAASHRHPTFYVFAGYDDCDAGGWLVSELKNNIELCLKEKTIKKNRNTKRHYSDWWLILINRIGPGITDPDDIVALKEIIASPSDWGKVILLDPHDHRRAFEI